MEQTVGKTCPYCQSPIKPGENVVVCPNCSIPHHRNCWEEGQGCTTFGCTGTASRVSDANQSSETAAASLATSTIYCRACGTEINSGSVFCPRCGATIASRASSWGQSSVPVYYQTGSSYGNNRSNYAQGNQEVFAYVGFWRRLAAYFIDAIILVIIGTILGAISDSASRFLSIIAGWLYFSLMESSEHQGTLGKMAIGAKVVDYDLDRISFGRATGRHFGKMLSGMILVIGFIMIAFSERKQGLHDMMAGTLVVCKD